MKCKFNKKKRAILDIHGIIVHNKPQPSGPYQTPFQEGAQVSTNTRTEERPEAAVHADQADHACLGWSLVQRKLLLAPQGQKMNQCHKIETYPHNDPCTLHNITNVSNAITIQNHFQSLIDSSFDDTNNAEIDLNESW